MSSSLLHSASPQAFSPDRKNSIIRRQRQELKLLIAELKDRDKELNDMVAVHERHIQAWEDDRQKILSLAERCSLLTSELNERNAIIKSLTKRLKLLESQHNDSKITLESTQQKFKELTQKVTDSSVHCQALEEKNQSLHCSVLELSAKTGQLQAREQELLTMLQLKDKALIETTDQITEVASKFKTLENALRAAKLEEFSRNREQQDLKLTLNDVVFQVNKMKDVLSEKMKESSKHQEEISHLKHENGCLRSELILAVEEAQRKDQLYQFTKSKQVRIEKELSSLRQVCVKQQRDLHFLQVNLDSSQECMQKLEKAASERSTGATVSASESPSKTDKGRTEDSHRMFEECGTAPVPASRVKPTPEMCEADHRQLMNASDLEETTSAFLNQCQKAEKGLAVPAEEGEKQDVASRFDELDSEKCPLRNREIAENGVKSRERKSFEVCLPSYDHWLNIKSRLDLQSTLIQNNITSDKTDNEERSDIQSGQKSRESPVTCKSESDSSINNFAVNKERWKPLSDLEWLEIFKPKKGDGNTCRGKEQSCFKTAQEMKCTCSKSEENLNMNSLHLASLSTSTQKSKMTQSSGEDSPLDISDLAVPKPTNRYFMNTDTSSLFWKLERSLAQSRQMLADLELSLLHTGPSNIPNTNNMNKRKKLLPSQR
ncbi:PREDICTED: coiled-coil domain-containing protein 62 [Ficedula albicollis]|uniref:coiled-coil domain-containing protein 62 n=1 Tax=Ficedula albicollis TaxID=59894 RepID=UPI000359C0FE|nr:PREDICTED: coiled-coil domain-containing protein 62 [Ficedula albicollis]XP_005055188.1 PREDICTED: coiled-coil domain-containing protein 62 [Ficedula albicollis]XP_005055189.1 PREDICTED: coiled-coil domain-containing protein 62 [Ficedula albicollis]